MGLPLRDPEAAAVTGREEAGVNAVRTRAAILSLRRPDEAPLYGAVLRGSPSQHATGASERGAPPTAS